MNAMRCWLSGFYWTWLNPGTWATRLRLMVRADSGTSWPYIVESGHLYDTEHPRYVVEDDREHEWMVCARCGADLYCGWRQFYGVAR